MRVCVSDDDNPLLHEFLYAPIFEIQPQRLTAIVYRLIDGALIWNLFQDTFLF